LKNTQNTHKKKVWSISGGAAKAVGLFEIAKVCTEYKDRPDIIIGTSSGALVAPIIAASYTYPELLDEAIKFAQSLNVLDMFPYKGNKPFKKNGKISIGSIFRVIGGHNHLGWQDIKPLYKKVFKQKHFDALKNSDINCISFSVLGKNGTPCFNLLNESKSIDDLIDLIERSSRMTPIVQHKDGHIDGGFISFSPGMWVLKDDLQNVSEYLSIYSHPIKVGGIIENKTWDSNIINVITQVLNISTYYLGYKDALIEEILCKVENIPYIRIECPNGFIDEIYETDDNQLKEFGIASRKEAIKILSK